MGAASSPIAKLGDFCLGMDLKFELAYPCAMILGCDVDKPALKFMPRQHGTPDVDIWAAAASLYNMLTGAFPKEFPPGTNALDSALKEQAVPIRKRNPGIPLNLAAVIDEALIDNPEIKIKFK